MSNAEHNEIRSRKRRGCDEECIRRIAAHLCQLEHAASAHSTSASIEQLCCESLVKPVAQVESACCSFTSTPKDNDTACRRQGKCWSAKNELMEAQNASKDKCCRADIDPRTSADCCEPPLPEASPSTPEECTENCCYTPESPKSTCSAHLQNAFDRYEALIRLGKCLCRTIREQLGICCCAPASCKPGRIDKVCASQSSESDIQTCGGVSDEMEAKEAQRHKPISGSSIANKAEIDIENEAAYERVIVAISGMTCTGCSRKMLNVLDHIPGVSATKITFVTEFAEFLLNTKEASVEHTLRRIERETGFKLTRVGTEDQELHLLLPGISAEEYARKFSSGLVTIERYDKRTFRVTYDPRSIGARSLLVPGVELAPQAIDPKRKEGQRRLLGTAISFASALVLTVPIVVLNWGHPNVSRFQVNIISLIIATFVQGISVPEFYIGAIKSLLYSRVVEMDMLVVLSISAAYLYSVIAFILELCHIPLEQGPFFETAALLITLVLLGRLLGAYARLRAISAVALRGLQSKSATLLLPDGGAKQIDARLLEIGDRFRVSAHSQIVTDGIVISGQSAVDESMITGECIPISKQPGDKIIAGTLNGPSELECRLTRLPGENSISDIAGLVEGAVEAKPKVQDLADMLASYFIPCVMAIALVVFAIWIAVAVKIRDEDAGGAIGTAITYAIAVLAVSCPCALGLAVPMVLIIAGGVAAKEGVVIKAALAIERGFQATDVVFDKTGTLTTGDLIVVTENFLPSENSHEEVIALVKFLVDGETHPVSLAVSHHLSKQQVSTRIDLQAKTSHPGLGIEAELNNVNIKAGNPYWLGIEHHPTITELLHEGVTLFCLAINNQLTLAFGLRSSLRQESVQVIQHLRSRHIACHIVSGDNAPVVERIRQALDIPSTNTAARSSPQRKQEYIARLQHLGRKVIFVGDGTNDAVAIAQATVGMQMGTASDVTGAVADVVLLGGLGGVVQFLDLSKRAFRRIQFNFFWAIAYNTFAILLAAGAFVKARVPPTYAGLGEIVSIAPVILAAVTLTLRWKV